MENRSITPENKPQNIDWSRVWNQQMAEATFRGNGVDFWNLWAKTIPNKDGASAYVKEVLERMHLEPGFSVLDVGAGMGALAIPLARQGHPVTAVDHSPVMLEILARNAAREELSNIRLVNLDWTQSSPGVDYAVHDVVLVSRSLPSGGDIAHSIRLIDHAARRACFITWKARAYCGLKAGICNLLGIKYVDLPDYIVLYNLLHSLGIYANVEIFRIKGQQKFRSLDEAFTQIIRNRNIGDSRMKERILAFLADKLSFQDGYYCHHQDIIWALLSWTK